MIEKLPPRERQIVDVLYSLGEATAAEIRDRLESPPSYSAVRAMLARLEIKGWVRHREEEQRYVYAPVLAKAKVEQTALMQVVRTFFSNSPAQAATALLGMSETLSRSELDALEQMIAKARKEQSQ